MKLIITFLTIVLNSTGNSHSRSTLRHVPNPSYNIKRAILQQFEDHFPNNNNVHLVKIQQPTGLFIAHTSLILKPKIIKCFKDDLNVDLNLCMNDYVCVLQHNSGEINPQYKGVHQINGFIPKSSCDEIISRAEDYASQNGGWTTERHTAYPTTDLPMEAVFGKFSSLQALISGEILARMVELFGLNEEYLSVNEMFIAKYECGPGKQSSLKAHQDGTLFSFIVTLNEPDVEFSGGGTRFLDLEMNGQEADSGVSKDRGVVYRPLTVGAALAFCGKQFHEGVPVTRGVRYILTGFCEYNTGDREGSHESYMEHYDPRWDGSAAASGLRTGDLLRGVVINSDSGHEILMKTEGQSVEQVYGMVSKSAKSSGGDVSIVVERPEEKLEGVAWEEGAIDAHDVLSSYVRSNALRLFSSGYCWGFDDILQQSLVVE